MTMDDSQTPHPPDASTDSLTVQVYLGERSYDILIGSELLQSLAAVAGGWMERITDGKRKTGKCLVVTDRNVEQPYAETVVASLRQLDWAC